MTRLGWIILAAILLVAAAFLSMTRFGGPRPGSAHPAVAVRPGGDVALAVPVAGVARSALIDSWGDARDGGARAHHGLDIAVTSGTPVLAAGPGTIEKLYASRLGGTTLYQRSADGRWVYYYAHLAGYAPGLHEGQSVRAGDRIGFVGDTGDAGAGNFHLHFGLQRMRPGDRWWQGEDVDPYPVLAGRAPGR